MFIKFYIRFIVEWCVLSIRNSPRRIGQVIFTCLISRLGSQHMQAADIPYTQPNVCFHTALETCKAYILNVATVLMTGVFFCFFVFL